MKKFEFSLQKLLTYKDQMLEKEKLALAKLNFERNAIEERRLQLIAAARTLQDELAEITRAGTTIFKINSFRFRIEGTHRQIKELEKELEAVGKRIEKQRGIVIAVQTEVKGLERLKEKQLEAYDDKVRKADAVVVDEHVTAKYITAVSG